MADEVKPGAGRWLDHADEVGDELLLLEESEAVESFFDEINRRRLRTLLWLSAATAAIYAVAHAATQRPWLAVAAGVAVLADLLLLRFRSAAPVGGRVRAVVAAVLVGHLILLNLLHPTVDADGPTVWFVLLLFVAARFRLAVSEQVAVYGALLAVLAARAVVVRTVLLGEGLPLAELVGFAVVAMVAVAVAVWVSYRERRRFVVRWRAEELRHRDRLRMKQELEYARSIQLSMLPRAAPEVGWLDIAALSLPATEVGGTTTTTSSSTRNGWRWWSGT